jgi:hypothetical protein
MLVRWVPLIAALFVCEWGALMWITTSINGVAPAGGLVHYAPAVVNWDYGVGCVGIAIPHEAGGRSPADTWNELLHGRGSVLGFALRRPDRSRPSAFMSTTMLVVPFWPVALLGAGGGRDRGVARRNPY